MSAVAAPHESVDVPSAHDTSVRCLCRAYAAANEGVSFVDCGSVLLAEGGAAVDPALLPDGLHPSVAGYELLAQRLAPEIERLVSSAAPKSAG